MKTPEELAIKYGFYLWDAERKCYICSPNFLTDLNKVIKSEQRSLTTIYQVMRKTLISTFVR